MSSYIDLILNGPSEELNKRFEAELKSRLLPHVDHGTMVTGSGLMLILLEMDDKDAVYYLTFGDCEMRYDNNHTILADIKNVFRELYHYFILNTCILDMEYQGEESELIYLNGQLHIKNPQKVVQLLKEKKFKF